LSKQTCEECSGTRLSENARNVFLSIKNISDISLLPIEECLSFFKKLSLTGKRKKIADKLIEEISSRLGFLK
jgi:excinuclease ABC subunit A